MKKTTLAALSLLTGLMVANVQAETIDVAKLKCSDLNQMSSDDEDSASTMMIWLDGYLSGVTGDTSLNDEALGNFTEKLIGACSRSPNAAILDTAKSVGIE